MREKLKYINRKGIPYYFREVSGKRGTQIVCSKMEFGNDLAAIPDTHEVVESPNGQVSCRKTMKYDLLPEEIALAKKLCPKLVKKNVRVIVEMKKKAIHIHSANADSMNELAQYVTGSGSVPTRILAAMEKNLRFEPALKLELSKKPERIFLVSRMCWRGKCDWMFLDEGSLEKLLRKYVPHIEQESFFELF